MATYSYDTAGRLDDAGGDPPRAYAYDTGSSRPVPVNPSGCRTNMIYDTGPRERADQPLIVTAPPKGPPGA